MDKDLGLEELPNRKRLFANKQRALEELKELFRDRGASTEFKMLGINYACTHQKKVHAKKESWEQAETSSKC